jgi:pyruvate, water dikinase
MAEYLVQIGIDSMSLNPDTVLKTTRSVLDLEARLGKTPRAPAGETGGVAAP